MTARLGRWLEKLSDAEARLNKIPRVRQYGRLTYCYRQPLSNHEQKVNHPALSQFVEYVLG